MKRIHHISLVLTLCLGFGAASMAVAEDAPQMVRQTMMKKMAGALGGLAAIAKGDKPYDAAIVKASFTTMQDVAHNFPDHFPVGSETGMGTEASPKIWSDNAGFRAKAKALEDAASKQLAALPADQAGVGAALKSVGGLCGDCHQAYRQK